MSMYICSPRDAGSSTSLNSIPLVKVRKKEPVCTGYGYDFGNISTEKNEKKLVDFQILFKTLNLDPRS
jgi:hypothetical protein